MVTSQSISYTFLPTVRKVYYILGSIGTHRYTKVCKFKKIHGCKKVCKFEKIHGCKKVLKYKKIHKYAEIHKYKKVYKCTLVNKCEDQKFK